MVKSEKDRLLSVGDDVGDDRRIFRSSVDICCFTNTWFLSFSLTLFLTFLGIPESLICGLAPTLVRTIYPPFPISSIHLGVLFALFISPSLCIVIYV